MRPPPTSFVHDLEAARLRREEAERIKQQRLAADPEAWRTYYRRPKPPREIPWWEYDTNPDEAA